MWARQQIDKLRNSLIGVTNVAITMDHWTDDMIKNAYQAFTLHYVNDQFDLVSTCIGVYEFTDAKTGIAVKAKTSQVLSGILPANIFDSSIVFVTDNGFNMKAAYRNDIRLSCAWHNLNLAVEKAL